MWENVDEADRAQTTIWRMRIACWLLKATNTHSVYVIVIVFPLQKWLHESALLLRHTTARHLPYYYVILQYVACLISIFFRVCSKYNFYATSFWPGR